MEGDDTLSLDAPRGISVETPPVRDFNDRQTNWRIRAIEPVRGSLRLTSRGYTIEKIVAAGDRTVFLVSGRVRSLFQFLLPPSRVANSRSRHSVAGSGLFENGAVVLLVSGDLDGKCTFLRSICVNTSRL
jgi:hypothetical protein